MRSDGVVVVLVFPDQMLQVGFAEHDEMIETFLLYTLNIPFGKLPPCGGAARR